MPNHGRRMTTKPVSSRRAKVQDAAMLLASIHSGVPGRSIAAKVMSFYKATVKGDPFKSRILRIVVPLIRDEIVAGRSARAGIVRKARVALGTDALRLNRAHLTKWQASGRPLRTVSGNNPMQALRTAYVDEGLEAFEDAFQYVHALANEL
jgi:hypothetical protein